MLLPPALALSDPLQSVVYQLSSTLKYTNSFDSIPIHGTTFLAQYINFMHHLMYVLSVKHPMLKYFKLSVVFNVLIMVIMHIALSEQTQEQRRVVCKKKS